MALEQVAQDWSNLRHLLDPIASKISSLNVRPAMSGHKAILRFTNNYGVEIFKPTNDDFFEMTVIKFRGGLYEFAFDTNLPDLNLGCTDEDVVNLCQEVSRLK